MANNHNADDSINPMTAIKFMAVVALVVLVVVISLSYVNLQRNEQVVREYTEETNAYISQNKQGVSRIFSLLFDESDLCNDLKDEKVRICQEKVSKQVHANLTDSIKDYSSMFFIRLDPPTKGVTILRLSGESTYLAPTLFKQYEPIKELLDGKKNELPWENYFYELENNEVIIPVDIDGKRVGAIVRGVIED